MAPNYNVNPHEQTHYFNTDTGKLLVGDEKLEKFLAAGGNPMIVAHLGELLVDKSIEIDPHRYERLDVDDWSMHQYQKYGRWLHLLTTGPEETDTNITEVVIARAFYLGLGPYQRRISAPARFGSFPAFYRAIEVTAGYQRGLYDNWTRDRFADHIVEVLLNKAANQSIADALSEKAHNHEGPSLKVIRGHPNGGDILDLLDERGYPNIRSWGVDTYLDWGVAFRLANNGLFPKKRSIDYLSRKRRGPSSKGTINHLGSLSRFQAGVDERYQVVVDQLQQRFAEHLNQLQRQPPHKHLLLSSLLANHIPLWLHLRMSSQYLLLEAMDPNIPSEKQQTAATLMRQRDFLAMLRGRIPGENIEYAKNVAKKLNLYDDIWPLHNPENLRVPPNLRAV